MIITGAPHPTHNLALSDITLLHSGQLNSAIKSNFLSLTKFNNKVKSLINNSINLFSSHVRSEVENTPKITIFTIIAPHPNFTYLNTI